MNKQTHTEIDQSQRNLSQKAKLYCQKYLACVCVSVFHIKFNEIIQVSKTTIFEFETFFFQHGGHLLSTFLSDARLLDTKTNLHNCVAQVIYVAFDKLKTPISDCLLINQTFCVFSGWI